MDETERLAEAVRWIAAINSRLIRERDGAICLAGPGSGSDDAGESDRGKHRLAIELIVALSQPEGSDDAPDSSSK